MQSPAKIITLTGIATGIFSLAIIGTTLLTARMATNLFCAAKRCLIVTVKRRLANCLILINFFKEQTAREVRFLRLTLPQKIKMGSQFPLKNHLLRTEAKFIPESTSIEILWVQMKR